MTAITALIILAGCQEANEIPQPDPQDCRCGEITQVDSWITGPGSREYQYTVQNYCTGNEVTTSGWNDIKEIGDEICGPEQW